MSWRYLRTSDRLTNISKLVLPIQHQHQQALSRAQSSSSSSASSASSSSSSSLSSASPTFHPSHPAATTIMKLLKPNSITNITILFAASLVAAWSMPLLVDGSSANSATANSASEFDHDSPSIADGGGTGTGTGTVTTKDGSTTSTIATSGSPTSPTGTNPNPKCPSYGCPLLPRDIYFDKEAQAALEIIRNLKLQQQQQQQSMMESSQQNNGKKQDEQDTNENGIDININNGQESISLFYNEAYIATDRSEDQATLTLIGYKGGEIQDQINQDRAFVISPFYIGGHDTTVDDSKKIDDPLILRLLGVFDGHAKLGERVSEYSVRELPHLLSSKLESILSVSSSSSSSSSSTTINQNKQIQNAINDTFIEIDKNAPAHESGGCTASIVLQIQNSIYIANAGDSRSFIATYNKKTQKTTIEYITREDKPDLPEEKQRVEDAGGVVYIPPPDRALLGASSRVVYVDKVTGSRNGLAMSRSIGDWAAGDHGVIPNPTVDVLDIQDLIRKSSGGGDSSSQEGCNMNYEEKKDDGLNDQVCHETKNGNSSSDVEVFAVSATDGLLDFMEVEEIAKAVAMSLYAKESPHPLSACESLISTAANGWFHAKNGRYRDDIAIAVSKLSLS